MKKIQGAPGQDLAPAAVPIRPAGPGIAPIAPAPRPMTQRLGGGGAPAPSPLAAVAQKHVIKSTSFAAYEEAKQILAVAEQEAARIKEEAARLRDEQVRLGYEEGHKQGYAAGIAGLARVEQEFQALCERLEPEIVKLAVKVAEKIVGAELAARPEAIAAIVSQALKTVRHQKEISIRVHPSHVAALEARKAQLLGVLTRARDVMIRGDDSIRPGGCVIESELGTLDADLETQLRLIEQALSLAR